MGTSSRGVHFFVVVVGNDGEKKLVRLKCISDLNYQSGSTPVKSSQCLDDVEPKYDPGESSEGSLSATLQIDINEPGHMEFINFSERKEKYRLPIAVGQVDGDSEPTLGPDDELVYPPDRTWRAGYGFVASNGWSATAGSDQSVPVSFTVDPGFVFLMKEPDEEPGP